MHSYNWMNTRKQTPATQEEIKAFALVQAHQHEQIAQEWAEKGDMVQVERWKASAAELRESAA